jgi:mRNA-degrading endonuclease RelE of RelBE toxin-antitoxin system
LSQIAPGKGSLPLPYRIDYCLRAVRHHRGLTANQRALLADAMEEQLRHQPTVETRNRKRLEANALARWELRVRNLRVFYDVEEQDEPVVRIRAIGIKVRDRTSFPGEEATFP